MADCAREQQFLAASNESIGHGHTQMQPGSFAPKADKPSDKLPISTTLGCHALTIQESNSHSQEVGRPHSLFASPSQCQPWSSLDTGSQSGEPTGGDGLGGESNQAMTSARAHRLQHYTPSNVPTSVSELPTYPLSSTGSASQQATNSEQPASQHQLPDFEDFLSNAFAQKPKIWGGPSATQSRGEYN